MKVVSVTPVFNEEILLPHFLRHYAEFCDVMVLWDNASTDRTVEIARAHPKVDLRRFETEGYDDLTALRLAEAARKEFHDVDWLLLPDVDEFLVPRDMGRARDALASADADVLVPDGYCIVQRPGEPEFDPARPISEQRPYGHWSLNYSKPVIIRPGADARYVPGKHVLVCGPKTRVERYRRFLLIHADMLDFGFWRFRKNRRPLSTDNIKHGYSVGHFCRNRRDHEKSWHEAASRVFLPIPAPGWDATGAAGR